MVACLRKPFETAVLFYMLVLDFCFRGNRLGFEKERTATLRSAFTQLRKINLAKMNLNWNQVKHHSRDYHCLFVPKKDLNLPYPSL